MPSAYVKHLFHNYAPLAIKIKTYQNKIHLPTKSHDRENLYNYLTNPPTYYKAALWQSKLKLTPITHFSSTLHQIYTDVMALAKADGPMRDRLKTGVFNQPSLDMTKLNTIIPLQYFTNSMLFKQGGLHTNMLMLIRTLIGPPTGMNYCYAISWVNPTKTQRTEYICMTQAKKTASDNDVLYRKGKDTEPPTQLKDISMGKRVCYPYIWKNDSTFFRRTDLLSTDVAAENAVTDGCNDFNLSNGTDKNHKKWTIRQGNAAPLETRTTLNVRREPEQEGSLEAQGAGKLKTNLLICSMLVYDRSPSDHSTNFNNRPNQNLQLNTCLDIYNRANVTRHLLILYMLGKLTKDTFPTVTHCSHIKCDLITRHFKCHKLATTCTNIYTLVSKPKLGHFDITTWHKPQLPHGFQSMVKLKVNKRNLAVKMPKGQRITIFTCEKYDTLLSIGEVCDYLVKKIKMSNEKFLVFTCLISRICQKINLEICTTDRSILKYTLQPYLGANTTPTICYNILKLKMQKLRVLVMIIQLEIFMANKSIVTQKICLGVNATSAIYYGFKLRAQNPRVLIVTTKLEMVRAYKLYITCTKQEFYQGINAMSAAYYNSYLNSNKNEW
jgi:hypothetical protein